MNDDCPQRKCDSHVSKAKIKCKTREELEREKKECGKPKKREGRNSNKIFETPRLLRTIGPKQVEALAQFMPSLLIYSAATVLATLYFTEWKTVLQYLPYYRGKYKDDEE